LTGRRAQGAPVDSNPAQVVIVQLLHEVRIPLRVRRGWIRPPKHRAEDRRSASAESSRADPLTSNPMTARKQRPFNVRACGSLLALPEARRRPKLSADGLT
jgi:hypothetical protein